MVSTGMRDAGYTVLWLDDGAASGGPANRLRSQLPSAGDGPPFPTHCPRRPRPRRSRPPYTRTPLHPRVASRPRRLAVVHHVRRGRRLRRARAARAQRLRHSRPRQVSGGPRRGVRLHPLAQAARRHLLGAPRPHVRRLYGLVGARGRGRADVGAVGRRRCQDGRGCGSAHDCRRRVARRPTCSVHAPAPSASTPATPCTTRAGCQDDCGIHDGCLLTSLHAMRDALNATGRRIIYYVRCGDGADDARHHDRDCASLTPPPPAAAPRRPLPANAHVSCAG